MGASSHGATNHTAAPESAGPIRIGVSSCLLGEAVRWDGNHKRDGYITGTLAAHFQLVPVCPELAIGLGVPREPIRLVGRPGAPRAVGVKDAERDVTDDLDAFGKRKARELTDLSGYLFKSGSPSCGMERVKVHGGRGGMPSKAGVGIYARALLEALPLLPAEEEGRLNDPGLRDGFIERVCAYRRWQDLLRDGLTAARLVDFHNRHKLALMAHGAEPARALGRIVAAAGREPPAKLAAEYGAAFMAVLGRKATRRTHVNVLMHAMGYLKRNLEREDKAELLDTIERYRLEQLPRAAPLTLLNHHFRRHPHPYIAGQTYFRPGPAEALLRTEV